MKRLITATVTLLLLISCAKPSLEGDWVQPIPGMENQLQGIKLDKGGKASSINMHTLIYTAWEKKGSKLILQGESIGNGQTIAFIDEYEIIKLNEQELMLKNDGRELIYQRRRD